MSIAEIIELVGLGITVVSLIGSIVVAIAKGKMRDFIVEKMEEAEASGKDGSSKLQYVIDEVSKKYKIAKLLMDTKAFVEKVIAATKKINVKGE